MIDTSIFQSTESVHVRFDEQDEREMLMCELITERFVGLEAPLMTFSRDGFKTLIVPRTITKVFDNAKPLTAETPSVHGISNGAGASNG